MGFCYGVSLRTGRNQLACDFCDKIKDNGVTVKKIKCPYGYCQAWATCNECKAKGKNKTSSCAWYPLLGEGLNENHRGCKIEMMKKPKGE